VYSGSWDFLYGRYKQLFVSELNSAYFSNIYFRTVLELLSLNTDISQGSVATHLGCGGVFKRDFVTNFLLSPRVKEF